MIIRSIKPDDLAAVLQLEQDNFEFPWSRKEFVLQLKQKRIIGAVAEHDGEIVGYMVYQNVSDDCVRQVSLISVCAKEKRRSVGRLMIEVLQSKCEIIYTMVRESNLPAQLFFKKMGFVCSEIKRGQYESTDEDAYIMAWESKEIVPFEAAHAAL